MEMSFEEQAANYLLGAMKQDEKKQFLASLKSASPDQLQMFKELYSAIPFVRDSTAKLDDKKIIDGELDSLDFHEPKKAIGTSPKPQTVMSRGFIGDLFFPAPLMLMTAFTVALVWALYNWMEVKKENLDLQTKMTVSNAQTNESIGAVQSLKNEIRELKDQITRQDTEIKSQANQLNFFNRKDLDWMQLKGNQKNSKNSAKLIWSPSAKSAVLVSTGLPSTPPDRDYQLWALKGKKQTSIGVFHLPNGADKSVFLNSLPANINTKELSGFAITLEQKGGNTLPTSPQIVSVNRNLK